MAVPDVFGLHIKEFTQSEIDGGAEALRQIEQGGRVLRKWNDLPNSDKRKWRDKSSAVLRAAFASRQPS